MIFLMWTVLKALTKNWLALKIFQNISRIETGIFDFHKLVVTMLKVFYKNQKPKIIQYRNDKTFNEQLFRTELDKELAKMDLSNAELAEFYNEFLSWFNKHAPVKYKYIGANNSSYITKRLRKQLCFVLDYTISFIRPKQKNLNNCNK